MKQIIFSNWNLFRVIKLLLGIAIIIQAFFNKDITAGIIGSVFTSMTILNIGCCGINGCATPNYKNTTTSKDISYEEIK